LATKGYANQSGWKKKKKKERERTGMKTDALWPESPYKGYNNESIEGPGRPSGEFRLSKVCPFFLPQLPPLVPVGERLLSYKSFSGEDQINIGERRKTGRQHSTHKREKCEAPLPRRLVLPTSANSFPKNTFQTDFSSHTHMFSTRSLIM
jgi:hypothetical protein